MLCLGSSITEKNLVGVDKVTKGSELIIEETSYGYSLTKTEEGNFRLLQLTDIHIGGGLLSIKNDGLAINAVDKVVQAADPDFIVVTGDIAYPVPFQSGTLNNKVEAQIFVDLMDALGVPWALTYGNHDTESYSLYDREYLTEFYSEVELCLMSRKNENIFGYGNQIITLHNSDGAVNTALVLLDSNDYVEGVGINEYDNIHDDQVAWYKDKIKEISAGRNELVPSLMFFHIPTEEFKEAAELYESGSQDVTYNQGYLREKVSCSDHESGIFEAVLELGSTKGIFVGHDHINNLDVTYKGVRLVYGLSIDYLAYAWFGIIKKTEQRGGTIIDIAEDASFTVTQLRLCEIEDDSSIFPNA